MAKLTTMTTYKTRISSEGAQLQLDYNHATGSVWLEVGVSCDPEDPSILAGLDDAKLSDLIDALTQFRELKASELAKDQQGKVFGDVTLLPPKPLTFADLGEGDVGCRFKILKAADEGDLVCVLKSGKLIALDFESDNMTALMIVFDAEHGSYWLHRDTEIERI